MESPESKSAYTVLVVDDLEDNRDLLSQWLERHGYRAVTASGGEEAFRVLDDKPIDLVLLDIQMPRMDGFEFLRLLRSHERLRSTPVICLTAHFTDPPDLSKGLSFASAYFTKPYSFQDLLMKMEVVLQSRGPMSAPSRLPTEEPKKGSERK